MLLSFLSFTSPIFIYFWLLVKFFLLSLPHIRLRLYILSQFLNFIILTSSYPSMTSSLLDLFLLLSLTKYKLLICFATRVLSFALNPMKPITIIKACRNPPIYDRTWLHWFAAKEYSIRSDIKNICAPNIKVDFSCWHASEIL